MFEVIQKVKIKYGDVNKDGRINSTDIMYLKDICCETVLSI